MIADEVQAVIRRYYAGRIEPRRAAEAREALHALGLSPHLSAWLIDPNPAPEIVRTSVTFEPRIPKNRKERNLRRHVCGRKKRFDVDKAAWWLIRKIEAAGEDAGLSVYECEWCGGFHIGHAEKREQEAA